ncbi:MAG: UDP-N-acetylglucosamine 1-carboxyvinyltransferase [Candidatus Omnitrophica bacterium]|nr:UDP-N-acetylglucosamine 1-carboxyvinyltransferase [Candidatus Omnitrophota bacterium]
MDKLILEPSGPLRGTVEVGGAKNAALPIMAACLLTEEECVIEGVPHVTDVNTMAQILSLLGVEVAWEDGRLAIHPNHYTGWTAPHELVSLMRASICVLGPLLARHGRAKVSMPGGCIIGLRPVDLHLKGLEALGATFTIEHGYIIGRAERLRGATIHLSGPFGSSVLATGNVMMAATLADGVTIIEHAACEPEVADLANGLVEMGAKITGQGTPHIRVEGVLRLHGARHRILPDRIEAGTLMIAAAMLGGEVTVKGAISEHLGGLIDKLREANVAVESLNGSIRVRSDRRVKGVQVTTLPFPGFPTDLQAQMMAMMTMSEGVSVVTEKIYPERFTHVPELRRMGAQITREGPSAIVQGVGRLSGAPVTASDLRASAALVLAGLAADTVTELSGVEHLDRGYEQLETKLTHLGAAIRRERG